MTSAYGYLKENYPYIGQGYVNGKTIAQLSDKILELEPCLKRDYKLEDINNAMSRIVQKHPQYKVALEKRIRRNREYECTSKLNMALLLEVIIFKKEAKTQIGTSQLISKYLNLSTNEVKTYVRYAKRWGLLHNNELKTLSDKKTAPKRKNFNWNLEVDLGLGTLNIIDYAYIFHTTYEQNYKQITQIIKQETNKINISPKAVEEKLKKYKRKIKYKEIKDPICKLNFEATSKIFHLSLEELLYKEDIIDMLLSA